MARQPAVMLVAAKNFIAAAAGEHHGESGLAGRVRDEVGIHAVVGGLVHHAQHVGQLAHEILAGDADFAVIGVQTFGRCGGLRRLR